MTVPLIPLLAVLATQLAVPAARAQEAERNLLPNPGFEEPLKAWKPWGRDAGAIVRDEDVAHAGDASIRLPDGKAALYTFIPLLGGHAYRVSGFVRASEAARAASLRFALCAADGGNGSAGSRQVALSLGEPDAWHAFGQTIVPSRETVQTQVVLAAEGGPVWFDDLSIVPTDMPEWADPSAGAWDGLTDVRTKNPVFEELLTDRPGGHYVTMWAHALQRASVPEPRQGELSDAEWEREVRTTFDQMGQHHLGAFVLPWGVLGGDEPEHFWRTDEFLSDIHERYALSFDAAAESSAVAARAVKLGAEVLNPAEVEEHSARPLVSPVDPAYVEACREEIERLAEILADRPYVRAIVGRDEPSVRVHPGPRADAGVFMAAADDEVRTKYGSGRYDMPAPGDPDWRSRPEEHPFRWIAFNRWMADRYADSAQVKFELVRRLNRDWRYIPCDFWLMSKHIPFDFSRMAKYSDIVQGDPYASSAERTPGRGIYNHGFGAKLLADLSRGGKGSDPKPVEIIVQAFDYAGYEVTPEDLLEWCSQALRCGATSLSFYASDAPRFNDEPRWRMMLHIAKTVSEMRAIRRPKRTRTAILYCSAAHAAEGASSSADEVYTAYALLGEKLGCWFDIISDRQLRRGLRDLGDYRIVYLPLATYADSDLADDLREWVEAGGTLVCGDPTAFSWAPDGSDISNVREELFGVRLGEAARQHAMIVDDTRMTVYPRRTSAAPEFTARSIEVAEGVEVLGTYPDRAPALVRQKLGEGTTVYFAANPFTPASLLDEVKWLEVLRGLQEAVEQPAGQPIWRFRLPAPEGEPSTAGGA